MDDTVSRVSRPRGELTDAQMSLIHLAKQEMEQAQMNYRVRVLNALRDGASFSEVAKFTGLSTATLQRWKRGVES